VASGIVTLSGANKTYILQRAFLCTDFCRQVSLGYLNQLVSAAWYLIIYRRALALT